ncbi:MAG: thiamine pyrophosphate-requiring protein [Dehalococcoidia bacterium]|nr:thiamine pyrophosphate-requiring protein [Dehalococcoidia bacterium]|tara:strand:- start:196 stop:1842 length:1647 start_codon:yes stop_codon:yes gene_type:complete
MNGNDAIAEILKAEGAEYLFCYPDNQLIHSCAAAGIRPVMSRTERTTVNMADGYTRMLNGEKNGVVVTQAGPGIENAYGGIAHAYADSVPILVIPGGTVRGRINSNPDFDAVANYKGITKWSGQINQTGRISEFLRRAHTFLRTGRGAPVLLEVPSDVAMEQIEANPVTYTPVKSIKSSGDPADIKSVASRLIKAERPVLYVGQGVLWAQASDELVRLAELLDAPVATTNSGKSAFPENHELALGAAGNTVTKMARYFVDNSDVIFGIGVSFTTNLASMGIPQGKTLIQTTVDANDLNKEHHLADAIIGDCKLVLRQLIEEIDAQTSGAGVEHADIRAEVASVRNEWLEEWMPLLTSDETPINPYRIIWDLMHTVDRDKTVVTHDSGHPRDQLIPFWESTVPRGYLGWGNSTQLGYSLGLVLGAKLAAPEKTFINFMGDAAIGMAGMDIETGVRLNIPVMTIVLNNQVLSGYPARYEAAVEKYGFTELYGDYAAIATALGAYGERISDTAEIVPAINRGLAEMDKGRPVLLEFMTSEENRLSRYPAAG